MILPSGHAAHLVVAHELRVSRRVAVGGAAWGLMAAEGVADIVRPGEELVIGELDEHVQLERLRPVGVPTWACQTGLYRLLHLWWPQQRGARAVWVAVVAVHGGAPGSV